MADAPQNLPNRGPDPEGRTIPAALESDPVPSRSTDGPPVVAGRYEILGMLGSGGMGTVYRARDRELDEIVALKLLRKELAAAGGMLERFRREVKLARRVTHRNVARTFDIGDHAGDRFLTMELIDGEMLGTNLARRGRVPLRDVVRIGVDVCAGLAAAHAAGVLHRDLKPENVILARDGRAVITDFGIARALVEGELGRTVGGLVGTPAYMAPEQVEGATDLDARADLYALGTMVFELLTGELAWPGETIIAIAASRLLKPPPDVRTHAPDLPEAAALLVRKLMARQREDRFSSAAEAGEAIAALQPGDAPSGRFLAVAPSSGGTLVMAAATARAQRKTVAVLPLLNLGSEEDEYLAQTLTEDLVNLLSVVRELRVRPRGETARFQSRTRDVREAGRDLGVDVVVDGSVRRLGETMRVSFRLVTVEDGFQLWARRFDGPPAHILNVADEAASAIAGALATELTAEARPVATDHEAQELYLRGRYLMNRAWFEVSVQGVSMLKEAHQRMPEDNRIAGTYALAVARILASEPNSHAAATEARDLAERTLARDPAQPEARVALGFVHINGAEGAAAAAQLRKALSLAPNSVEALECVGRMLVEVGRPELGMATLRRALAIDPLLTQARHAIARGYALLGDMARAMEVLGPIPAHAGDFVPYTLLKGRLALWVGDRAAATDLERTVADAKDISPFARGSLSGLLNVVRSGTLDAETSLAMDRALPSGKVFSPRRAAYHAQIKTEVKLAVGATAAGLADLRVADANGLLDLLWLDRCPVFDAVRTSTEFVTVREATVVRADRVTAILDP